MGSITRRDAIKKIGVAGATLSTGSMLYGKSTDEKKLGVALVGLGNYATRQLGPALQQCDHCELKGLVTGSPEKIPTWKKEYGIEDKNIYNYKNFDSIKDNEAIDIVYIVLPNFMHAEYTIRALEAGKHVICEKPMAMNSAECRAMIAAAAKARKKLQIGYRLFYEPHHLHLIDWRTKQNKDKLTLVQSSLGYDMARPGSWRIDLKKGGGGAIMDLAPYTIQAGRRIVGTNPIAVQAIAYKDNPEVYKDIFGTYVFQLFFEDQTVFNSTVSFSAFTDRLKVSVGNAYQQLQPSFGSNRVHQIESREEPLELPRVEFQQTTQMDAFALNILNDTPIVASGEEGLIDLQIIEAIKQSAKEGRRVDIVYS